jgi:hypothetical protein
MAMLAPIINVRRRIPDEIIQELVVRLAAQIHLLALEWAEKAGVIFLLRGGKIERARPRIMTLPGLRG